MIYFKSKSKIIFSLLKINIIVLISIVFFPLGKLGLKYLENDYINQVPLKNIENIIVLAGSEDISSTIKTNKNKYYSTVTDFARFLGLSISYPFSRAE